MGNFFIQWFNSLLDDQTLYWMINFFTRWQISLLKNQILYSTINFFTKWLIPSQRSHPSPVSPNPRHQTAPGANCGNRIQTGYKKVSGWGRGVPPPPMGWPSRANLAKAGLAQYVEATLDHQIDWNPLECVGFICERKISKSLIYRCIHWVFIVITARCWSNLRFS